MRSRPTPWSTVRSARRSPRSCRRKASSCSASSTWAFATSRTASIESNKFYEAQKYVSGTNHVYASNPLQVSKRFWDRLSPAEQRLLQDAAIEAQNWQRTVSREVSAKALTALTAKGMVYNDVPPAELARMRAAVQPVYDKFSSAYDPAIVNLFKSELDRVSKL